jgi:hypothetical protein
MSDWTNAGFTYARLARAESPSQSPIACCMMSSGVGAPDG